MANFANYGNLESILTTYANKINGKANKTDANKVISTDYTLAYNSWEAGTGAYLGYYVYEIETNPRLNGDFPVQVYLTSSQSGNVKPTDSEYEAFNDNIIAGDMYSSDIGEYTKVTILAANLPVDRSGIPMSLKVSIEGVKY